MLINLVQMKNLATSNGLLGLRSSFLGVVLIALGLAFAATPSRACNLSSFTLNSIVPATPDTIINFTLCIGGGRTGAVRGADNSTNSFAIVLRRTGGVMTPPLNIVSYSPASVTGNATNCTMPALVMGPNLTPNAINSLFFIDPGYYGSAPCVFTGFSCVSSTPLCGNVATQCINFSIRVNYVPDSICATGIEGGGNFEAGCGCATMGAPLRNGILGIIWGEIDAKLLGDDVQVSWQSLSESGEGRYHLERQMQEGEFMEISSQASAGRGQTPRHYSYKDPSAGLQGNVNYRLRFVDQNGESQYSSVASVQLPIITNFALRSIYPLPAQDLVHARLLTVAASDLQWTLIDATGKSVGQGQAALPAGESDLKLDLSHLQAGAYYLQCRVGTEVLTHKVVKL